MRIDIRYIRDLFSILIENDDSYFTIEHPDIERLLNEDEKNFIFHMEILRDKGVIENLDGSRDLGFRQKGDGTFCFVIMSLRITAKGHKFEW